jgi:hypothetical protein
VPDGASDILVTTACDLHRTVTLRQGRGRTHEEHPMGNAQGAVQNGWQIRTNDGEDLGTVIDSRGDSMIVDDGSGTSRSIPKRFLDQEEEGSMVAILSIDSAQADELDSDLSRDDGGF